MATYGRGHHITPSIQSVLQQDLQDFELIVVGDHCQDDTEQAVAAVASPRLSWMNLSSRYGSQSAPNNAGITASAGDVIAYIGHDDIWEPGHLGDLAALMNTSSLLDFAVAGAIYHLPPGIAGSQVTGLFDTDSDKHIHFFPPSSLAHRKSVCDRIGPWVMPQDVRAPVDGDFLLRAARADLTFASTGKITVHKFAAGHRYLSYLQQESSEQRAILGSMRTPGHQDNIAGIVAESKREDAFMIIRHLDYGQFAPGELARQNAERKGLVQQVVALPDEGAVIRQAPGHFALDWQDIPLKGIRWTDRNPNPKILLPYSSGSEARLSMRVWHRERDALSRIRFRCNGKDYTPVGRGYVRKGKRWSADFHITVTLLADGPSVMQFLLEARQAPDKSRRGIGISTIRLVPNIETVPIRARFRRFVDWAQTGL